MLQSSSWAKVSGLAIMAACGTVLGTTAIAAAQSAPVRIEKRVQVVTDDEGGPQVRVQVEDGEGRALKRRAAGQGGERQERRVIVKSHGDGEGEEGCDCGCPCCGGDDEGSERSGKGQGGAQRRVIVRNGQGQNMAGAFGAGGEHGKAIVLGPDGQHHEFTIGGQGGARTKVFRLDGGKDKAKGEGKTRSFGKAVIVGPDGKTKEFNFGDGQGGAQMFRWEGEGQNKLFRFDTPENGEHKIELKRFYEGQGGSPHVFRWDGEGQNKFFRFDAPENGEHKIELKRFYEGQGGGAGGKVRGHIVIVGPDGKEQVFDFGGQDDLKVRRVAPMELHDGHGPDVHLWRMQEDDGAAKERKVMRLRGQGGGVL